MDSETWLQKAERLRVALDELPPRPALEPDEAAARESIAIALWLRHEFSPTPDPLE